MERLTDKEMCNFTNMEFQAKQIDWHSIYNKLAEFEDFMASLGCEELEQLEHLIGYPRFVDGYNEQGKEINRIEFITYKESFNEVLEKNKKLKQENQALKDRWQKLKEWVKEQSNPMDNLVVSNDETKYIYMSDIFDEMQELEKEKQNE